jgi:hypothetical protein
MVANQNDRLHLTHLARLARFPEVEAGRDVGGGLLLGGDQQMLGRASLCRFTLNLIGSVQSAIIGLRTVRHVNLKDGSNRLAVFNTELQVVEGREEQTFITWEKISPGPTA